MTTVKELISMLKRYDQNLRVEFEKEDGEIAEDFSIDEAFGVVILKEF